MEINKEDVRKRFRRSMASYEDNARVQKIVVDRLCPLVEAATTREMTYRILEVGCGTGLLTSRLKQLFPDREALFVNDLVPDLCFGTAEKYDIPRECCLPGDIEQIELPRGCGLIVSASTFQWFTHPSDTFRKFADTLAEGGMMVFSTFGKHNLHEIRSTSGGGLDYRTKEELSELLSPYFEVLELSEEQHVLEFDTPLEVLQHLKRTGVNVSGDRTVWTKSRVDTFIDKYNRRFAVNGRVPLTYHPLYFVCRKLMK